MTAGAGQISYEAGLRAANPGQAYDIADLDALGRSAEGSIVRFGAAVVQGTNDNQAQLPDTADVLGNGATTGKFVGITLREHTQEGKRVAAATPLGNDETVYKEETESLSIARAGRVWVVAEEAVVPGDPVFFRTEVGAGGAVLGAWRTDADTATAVELPTAQFIKTAGIGELTVIELKIAFEA